MGLLTVSSSKFNIESILVKLYGFVVWGLKYQTALKISLRPCFFWSNSIRTRSVFYTKHTIMPTRTITICLIGLLLSGLAFSTCSHQAPDFVEQFKVQTLPDTLRFAIADADVEMAADTISNPLFFSVLPSDMYADIDYVADSSSVVVLAKARFELDPPYQLLWADMRFAWFQHQSLLLYDTKAGRITDRITAAELYGGESGQIVIGAWLLNGEQIVQRQASHSIRLDEAGEAVATTEQYVQLWKIAQGRFVRQPVQDTAKWIGAFPLAEW